MIVGVFVRTLILFEVLRNKREWEVCREKIYIVEVGWGSYECIASLLLCLNFFVNMECCISMGDGERLIGSFSYLFVWCDGGFGAMTVQNHLKIYFEGKIEER